MRELRLPFTVVSLLLMLLSLLAACTPAAAAPTSTQAPPSTDTPLPPPPTTIAPTPTPTMRALPTQSYTADPEAQQYLEGVESILRHSARIYPDLTLGLGYVCPDRYVIAFLYEEPDARGGRTLHVDALPQDPDGTVHQGEHHIIWSIQREGLWWDRWNRIYMTDQSEPGHFRIQFLLEEPQGTGWEVGTAFGTCPGDDLQLTGLFLVENYLDFELIYTRYSEDAPYDFWLRDGDQLLHYHWRRWEETLLWTLDDAPGTLAGVQWSTDSPDIDGDGAPDLILYWNIDDDVVLYAYTAVEDGFELIGTVESE